MSQARFEFWYDFSSPFAYLGSTQVEALAARCQATIEWRPFLLGGLFKLIGTPDVPLFTWSEAKRRYTMLDMQRHADLYGVPFRWPSHFPLLTVAPLRLALAAGPDIARLSRGVFHAFWAEDRDISKPEELTAVCTSLGLPAELVGRTQDPAIKEALKRSTEEARDRGLCGAPSFVVGSEVFWGQDRLHFVERALRGQAPTP
jgi:2-hydroxychromene-2-carboxylate isomerase